MQAPSPFSKAKLEIAFAIFIALFGGLIIIGALEMKVGWSGASPESGYFPFRVGVLIVIAACLIVFKALKEQAVVSINLNRIAWFFLPLLALVVSIPYIGLYVSAFGYLLFMLKKAQFSRIKSVIISLATPLFLFIAFEFIFKTPLPKGVLKYVLGA